MMSSSVRHRPWVRGNTAAVLLVALAGAARAAPAAPSAPGSGDEPLANSAPQWTLTAGSEYGRDESRGSLLSIDYAGRDVTDSAADASPLGLVAVGASGLHTDTPAASAAKARATGTTATDSGHLYFRYGRDALRGGVAFDSTRDQDFRGSRQWTGTLHSGANGWGIDANVASRQTRFDGAFDCGLRDVGFGGTLSYGAATWSAYGSGSAYRYQDAACSSRVFGANEAVVRAGGQIGEQTQLLQSQIGAGAAHLWGRTLLAFDYTHARAGFGEVTQAGYAVSATRPLRKTVSVKLSVGTTITNSLNAPYAGLYVSVDL